MPSGAECYRRFLDGDERAFDRLMEMYHDGLILFINKLVGNYAVAEELAADTFVELLLRKPKFFGNSDFRTYLYSIGRYKAIDFIRKEVRRKTVAIEDVGPLSDETDITEALIEDDTKRALHRAIDSLSEDYRAAVYLVFFEELSYAEAARILGKSKKQIDNLIYRAKGMLRKILTEGGGNFAGS